MGIGAGGGIIAKAIELGGIDFIVIYNSSRFRITGAGSLAGLMPYRDAHQVILEVAHEVLSIVKKTSVIAGICGTHPFYQGGNMRKFLRTLKDMEILGVQNSPTVGLIDKNFYLD